MAARLTSTFVSQNGTEYRVELHDQLYTGAAIVAEPNSDGFVISVGEADSERYQPILGSSCAFTYLVDSNALENVLTDIANSEEKRFQLVVYRAGLFYWVGQVAPDLVEIEDVGFPFYATITATDVLASLDMDYEFDLVSLVFAFKTPLEAVYKCLANTGLNSYFNPESSYLKTAVHWYPKNSGHWDIATAYVNRVTSDGGLVSVPASQLRNQILSMQSVELTDSFSYVVQRIRARVISDGGVFVGSDAQILAAYPDSIELREGTPGAFGYNPLSAVEFNELGLFEQIGNVEQNQIQSTVGEVLRQIVSRFAARIYWSDGTYNIDQITNFHQPNITTYVYYPDGNLKYPIVQENRSQISDNSTNRRGGGGLTRFYRPISSVKSEFKIRLNTNLYYFRNAQGIVDVNVLPGGANYKVSFQGEYKTSRQSTTGTSLVLVYRVAIKFLATNGTVYYLTNGNPVVEVLPGFTRLNTNWKPSNPIWSLSESYVWIYDMTYAQQGVTQGALSFSVTSASLPSEGKIQFNQNWQYLINGLGTDEGLAGFSVAFNNGSIFLVDNNAIDNTTLEFEAKNENGKFNQYDVGTLLLGDSPVLIAPGALLCTQVSEPFYKITDGWQRDPDAPYEDISRLHAREILAGQQVAVQKIDAWFIQQPEGISLRKRLVRGGKAFIFNGVNLIASADEWRGTWFEVASINDGITTNTKPKPPVDPRTVVPAVNQPGDDTYLVLNNAQQFGFDLLRTFRITEITADIPAGATTSISITALGEAYLQAGDQLVIVDTATGQLHQVTLTAAVSAAATSISISSVVLPAIAAGSAIAFTGRRVARMIKKIDSGTIANLPISASGIGNETTPVQIDAVGGVVKGMALQAGEEVVIDGETGDVNTSGGVSAAGNIGGQEVIAVSAVKAGTKVTLDAATGNVSAQGNVAAEGNVTGDELQASVAIKAGTKVTIDAATGNVTADGDMSANDVSASGNVSAGTLATSGDVSFGRDVQIADNLRLLNLPVGYTELNAVYLEWDDVDAYVLKIKLSV